MSVEFVKAAEKKKIIEKLNEEYGIEDIPYLLIKSGKGRYRAYSGSLGKVELVRLANDVFVETIGIYLLSEEENESAIRLGFDAPNLLEVKKNILDISKEQADEWLLGRDIHVDPNLHGFFVLKFNDDFLGCGKASQGMIKNYVPKERRRRN